MNVLGDKDHWSSILEVKKEQNRTEQNRTTLRYSGTRDPTDEYQTSKKFEIAAKINFRIKKRY
jgi:hypothetical protein